MKHVCGAIILDQGGRVLLGKRGEGMGEGQYSLIGGKLDVGESAESAIIQEVKEEIGVSFVPTFYSESVNINSDPTDPWKTTYFTGEIAGDINLGDSEIKEVIFASEEDLDRLDIVFDHREILKEFFQSRKS